MPIEYVTIEDGRRLITREVTGAALNSREDVYSHFAKVLKVDKEFSWTVEGPEEARKDERVWVIGWNEPLLVRLSTNDGWSEEVKDAIGDVERLLLKTKEAGFDLSYRRVEPVDLNEPTL